MHYYYFVSKFQSLLWSNFSFLLSLGWPPILEFLSHRKAIIKINYTLALGHFLNRTSSLVTEMLSKMGWSDQWDFSAQQIWGHPHRHPETPAITSPFTKFKKGVSFLWRLMIAVNTLGRGSSAEEQPPSDWLVELSVMWFILLSNDIGGPTRPWAVTSLRQINLG